MLPAALTSEPGKRRICHVGQQHVAHLAQRRGALGQSCGGCVQAAARTGWWQPTRRQVLSERGGLQVVERKERARTAPAGDGGEKRGEG
jgi:hypothetical protein